MHTTIAAHSDRLSVLSGEGDIVGLVNSMLPGTWKVSIDASVFCSGLHSMAATIGFFRSQYKLVLLYIFVHVLVEIGQFYCAKQLIRKEPKDAKNMCLEASRDVVPAVMVCSYQHPRQCLGYGKAGGRHVLQRPQAVVAAVCRHRQETLLHVKLMHHNVSSHLLFNDSDSVNVSVDFEIDYLPLKTFEASRRATPLHGIRSSEPL
ncbi:hypothetical protein MRX96_024390 [Rhipicephalus microplus]